MGTETLIYRKEFINGGVIVVYIVIPVVRQVLSTSVYILSRRGNDTICIVALVLIYILSAIFFVVLTIVCAISNGYSASVYTCNNFVINAKEAYYT